MMTSRSLEGRHIGWLQRFETMTAVASAAAVAAVGVTSATVDADDCCDDDCTTAAVLRCQT